MELLELNEFFMKGDAVVLATPEIAGLPYVISGLVAAGGMAAAMSTADGLVLAISNALSHDIYYKIINPKAETAKRLIVARILLVLIGFAGATIAALEIQDILGSVIWAFDFAMSGLFFPLVLGVWWKRANAPGAVAGMLLGLGSGTAYLIWVKVVCWSWFLRYNSTYVWNSWSSCKFSFNDCCQFNYCSTRCSYSENG